MNLRLYCFISGALFSIVAFAHLARLVFGWEIYVDNTMVPMWVSWAGLVIPGLFALWAFMLVNRLKTGV